MLKAKKKIGNRGELMAAHFLSAKGYQILERNYFLRGGELDLICLDGEELVFVEVKTRTNSYYGDLMESLSRSKIQKLEYSAEYYLQKHHLERQQYRIDLLGLKLSGVNLELEHLIDIFC